MTQKHEILVGSHISTAGGLHLAIERGQSIGATAIQIFTKSNRQWNASKITDHEAQLFKDAWKVSTIQSIVVHAAYLINIGSKELETAKKSAKALLDEVRRCEQLGIKYLILHPGSHLGAGEEKGIEQIAHYLDEVLEQAQGHVTILLETMAGQGTNMGHSFEQLQSMRAQSKHKRHVGFCLDTCHVFCAGYNLATEADYEDMMKKFGSILGFEHLYAIHVNDSLKPHGSRLDRHAPLGEGKIPLNIFKLMMNDKRLVDVPKILETPSDPEMRLWAKEIKMLRGMVGGL